MLHSIHIEFTNHKNFYHDPRPHYDDCVRDPLTGAKSEWTLLIYLTGGEDGVEGGEVNLNFKSRLMKELILCLHQTLFYKQERGKPRETIKPLLKRGTALLHRFVNFARC